MRIRLGRISLRNILQGLGTSRPLLITLRMGLGLVFIYASVDKVVHPDQFAEIMQDYEILPNAVVNLASLWLAWLEAVLGVCLIAGVWVRAAALMVTGLTVIFIGGLSTALTRGVGLHCGCFSTAAGGAARTWISLWQEGLILLACVWLTVLTLNDATRGTKGPGQRPVVM
jgi:cobalt-zinc-cadmium efflux system protein